MTTATAQSPPSDNDSGERPVRQQLKETNLDAVNENTSPARANRKRSFDNTDGATDTPPTKRSRECTPDTSDSQNASTKANPKHAGVSTTQDVSDNTLATTPTSAPVQNTYVPPLFCNPIMGHIPETTKLQFPLDLEIKISIGGSEQISHLTIPVEIGIKVTAGSVPLAPSTSRSAEDKSSKIHITVPAEMPIPPSGHPCPGHVSSEHPSPGHPSPAHVSSADASSADAASKHPSSKHISFEPYVYDDPSFYEYEEPEPIGDSSPEDSLPDYRSPTPVPSPEYPSSPPSVPYSSSHPDYPRPAVEVPDSNYSQYPQNLETTAANEDESSQTLKKKRSREQLEDDVSKTSHAATAPALGLTETTPSDEKSTAEGQPDKKRPRDNSEERKAKVEQTFTASAFGKASANSPSPFAMPANKSAADASPFATSGASTTGFGALGSGFSAFGTGFSGTSGKLTSFASPNVPTSFSGTAGKLTSFASPNAPVSFGQSSDKTLGAKQSDNEESDNELAGEPDDTFVAEKTDERFHEQTVETGEENETTEFTAKGKLYYFDDKKWKERGTGTFKVNLKTESDGKKSCRIIMRADGALRVMLNSAIWSTMPFGDNKGGRPATRDIFLASKEDEKVVSLLLRLGSEKPAGELYDVLEDIINDI